MKAIYVGALLLMSGVTCVGAAEKPPFQVIEVQQTGGFAGVKISYRITPDGKYSRKSNRGKVAGKLEKKELEALLAAIKQIDWKTLPKELRDPNVADDFLYDMHVVIGKTTHHAIADGVSAGKHAQWKTILKTLVKIQRQPLER